MPVTKSLNPRNGVLQLILSADKLIKCTDWLKIGFKVLGKHLNLFILCFLLQYKNNVSIILILVGFFWCFWERTKLLMDVFSF